MCGTDPVCGLPPLPPHDEEPARRLAGFLFPRRVADRLEQAVDDDVKILALTIDERANILASLEDPPGGLAELRAVLLSEHEWLRRGGLG